MNKLQVMRLAKKLTEAVGDGWITEKEAKRRFERIVRVYKRQQSMQQLQKEDPLAWMWATKLISTKVRG